MLKLYSAADITEANFVADLLNAVKIEAMVLDDDLLAIDDTTSAAEITASVWICDELKCAEARGILDAYLQKMDDKVAGDGWNCPKCGEKIEGQFIECWNCGAIKE